MFPFESVDELAGGARFAPPPSREIGSRQT
jgi:hypothetical protein